MKHPIFLLAAGLLAAPALAAEIKLNLTLPQLAVAEYKRPYVAAWIERPDNKVAAQLAVWYDAKLRNDEGTKWLADMRLWWRRVGRDVTVPIDAVTSATRNPGLHSISFVEGKAPLAKLPAGEYRLQVEAVREHGGRELLTVPFTWPPREVVTLNAQGKHELGAVSLELKP